MLISLLGSYLVWRFGWNQHDSSSGLRVLVLMDLELILIFLELVSLFRTRIKKIIILKNWTPNWIPQFHLCMELELF
jgi:hypothetical protein